MAERKVINKYYPPDFDPAKIPRRKRPVDEQHKVRLMAPFSMRCGTCGEWIAKGKKFNARKEEAGGEKYLTIQIYRFYIRCPRCSAEITFKTDPKNSDYVCEHGAARNFEPWRGDPEADAEDAAEAEAEDNNPMRTLEERTLESKREIEVLDALDEIRSINARHEKLGRDDAAVEHLRDADEDAGAKAELDEDEQLVQAIFRKEGGLLVRRLPDVDDDDDDEDAGNGTDGSDGGGLTSGPLAAAVAAAASAAAAAPRPATAAATAAAAAAPVAGVRRPASEVPATAVVRIGGPPEAKKPKLTASALGIVVKKKA